MRININYKLKCAKLAAMATCPMLAAPDVIHVLKPRGFARHTTRVNACYVPRRYVQCSRPDLLGCRHLVQGAFALPDVAVEARGRYDLLHSVIIS